MKYYDMIVLFYPGKPNLVVNSIIRMTLGSKSHVEEAKKDLVKENYRLPRLSVRLENSSNGCFIVYHNFESCLVVKVKSKKHLYQLLMEK